MSVECNERILLSIIIPVYNTEQYIDACLQSIVEQAIVGIEVILINDGSTDNSGVICQEYCKKYNYMILHEQENQGQAVARNKGISMAKGKYLMFLDSDDYLLKGVLKDIMSLVSVTNDDVILGKYDKYHNVSSEYRVSPIEYTEELSKYSPIEIYTYLTKRDGFYITIASVIVKREFIVRNHLYFPLGIFHEDELWFVNLFFLVQSIQLLNKSIFCYRVCRSNSTTTAMDIKKEFDRLYLADQLDSMEINMESKVKTRILKDRKALWVWSAFQYVEYYKDDPQVDKLKEAIKERIGYLKYGRYIWKWLLCKFLGIEKACIVYHRQAVIIKSITWKLRCVVAKCFGNITT